MPVRADNNIRRTKAPDVIQGRGNSFNLSWSLNTKDKVLSTIISRQLM